MSTPGAVPALRVLAAGFLLAAGAGLAACSSDEPAAKDPTPSAQASAAPPPSPPPSGGCYDLTFAEAAEATSDKAPVPCSARHTTATIQVGTINPVVDGHLLAVDSDSVQEQIATQCHSRLARYVGGSQETRRLSRLTVVWFSPSLEQSDQGALWYRCDVVALGGPDRLAPLPRSVRGLLDAERALDRWGTCGTSSPASPRFQRVICSQRHSWRARATITLPEGARYLGKAAGADADSRCRDIDAQLAADSLKLQWSFEWPTREQWDQGQRYGFCWTPDPA